MTYKELDEYYLLGEAISSLEEDIMRKEAALVRSPAFNDSGIPKNPSPGNIVEERYIALITAKEKLCCDLVRYKEQKRRVESYIAGIPDLFTQRLFQLRVFERMRWRDIAARIGGGNTENSVKQAFCRYLQKNP